MKIGNEINHLGTVEMESDYQEGVFKRWISKEVRLWATAALEGTLFVLGIIVLMILFAAISIVVHA